MAFELTSPEFKNNEMIPIQHTCDGLGSSPELNWSEPPKGTQSFVLICDDADAPGGIWDHWILFNIPPDTTRLDENAQLLPGETENGKNSWGHNSYGGPCPPSGSGVHHYFFKIYALDTMLNLPSGATKKEVEDAMAGHILDETYLVGKYHREE